MGSLRTVYNLEDTNLLSCNLLTADTVLMYLVLSVSVCLRVFAIDKSVWIATD